MEKLKAYIRLSRPHQYLKNVFIWLPIFFGYRINDPDAVFLTALAFAAFSLMASTVYIINDIKDMEEDRCHPVKKLRPLANGRIRPREAVWAATALFTASLAISLIGLPRAFVFVVMAYLLLNIAYSQGLKHLPIIDIVCIAMGFVLRILAGGVATGVRISHWIVIMTFLLALFLGLAKRRDDLVLNHQGHDVRKATDGYNLEFISLAMGIMASVIIVLYILYSVSAEVVAKHGTGHMYVSGIWVLLGLLRYLQITFVAQKSGSPTRVLLKDYLLQAVIVLWLVNIYILLYG